VAEDGEATAREKLSSEEESYNLQGTPAPTNPKP